MNTDSIDEIHENGVLTYKDLQRQLKKSRATLWRWVRAGLLPPPIQLGPNSVGWRRSTYEAWLNSRPTKSRGES